MPVLLAFIRILLKAVPLHQCAVAYHRSYARGPAMACSRRWDLQWVALNASCAYWSASALSTV